MNRRGFIKALLLAPIAVMAAKVAAFIPTRYTHETHAMGFWTTEEAMADLKAEIENTRHIQAARMLNNGFSTKDIS